jgi:hypothetical protein
MDSYDETSAFSRWQEIVRSLAHRTSLQVFRLYVFVALIESVRGSIAISAGSECRRGEDLHLVQAVGADERPGICFW